MAAKRVLSVIVCSQRHSDLMLTWREVPNVEPIPIDAVQSLAVNVEVPMALVQHKFCTRSFWRKVEVRRHQVEIPSFKAVLENLQSDARSAKSLCDKAVDCESIVVCMAAVGFCLIIMSVALFALFRETSRIVTASMISPSTAHAGWVLAFKVTRIS